MLRLDGSATLQSVQYVFVCKPRSFVYLPCSSPRAGSVRLRSAALAWLLRHRQYREGTNEPVLLVCSVHRSSAALRALSARVTTADVSQTPAAVRDMDRARRCLTLRERSAGHTSWDNMACSSGSRWP